MTAALMFQGTGSDVGKSLIVAGLARAYTRRGLAVRPFKPQNMSNNAAPAAGPNGATGEIGRAQALQARACGVAPSVDMNPVLLKPQSEVGAQVVVQGCVRGNADARAYHDLKPQLLPAVLESFERLQSGADLVLIEGAGSPAETNLRIGDIANMGFAEAADVAVALVGDIERGGVIASLVGTWSLLKASEQARIRGYIVNKFRGDPSLFDGAHADINAHTGLTSFGVVPWFEAAYRLPAEDSASLAGHVGASGKAAGAIHIAVPRLPRIANFDDFDPLRGEPDVAITLVPPGQPLPVDADLIILPGSKSTLADLAELRRQGWDIDILAAARRGANVFGICGGYQMLGRQITDPEGIEGPAGRADGLGLLDIETIIGGDKSLAPVSGRSADGNIEFSGYEMHMGQTAGPDTTRPLLNLDCGGQRRLDGAVSPAGNVAGTYVHGLFAADAFRHHFLSTLRGNRQNGFFYDASIEQTLDALAEHLEASLDLNALLAAAED
ncbi:MAG: cobyric acid synthase [Alphaproteobacteria bacterium]|nr:cobyric acid synthase [Alphaproteobacteria bacterium]